MKKSLATALLLLNILCLQPLRAQISIATIKPESGTIRKTLLFTGETRPLVESYAAADVSGPVAQILVEDGQKVEQNQVLAKIDEVRFNIAMRQTAAVLERAKQQLKDDEKDLERNKTLFDRKAITQRTYDMAYTTFIKSKTALQQAQADYDKAKLDLERCAIRALISGYFIDRSIELGQAMARGQNMGKVIHLDHVYIDARIPGAEIRNIKKGQICSVNGSFAGVVEHINLYADSSRSFRVRIKVANPDLHFKGNMFVKGTIILEQYDNVPLFPTQAIRNFRNEQYVFLVKEGKAHRQVIKIVAQDGDYTYAREVEAQDEVVTIGQDNLEQGIEVVIRKAEK